jgi:hypothetical protein
MFLVLLPSRQPDRSLMDYYPDDGVLTTIDFSLRDEPTDRRLLDHFVATSQQN